MTPSILRNRYFLMRHGQSQANVEGIIVSDPENGCSAYGLTEAGRQQIRDSLRRMPVVNSNTLIYCSDFLRTRESAALVSKILNTAPALPKVSLRERYFGDFEKRSDSNYTRVWEKDALNGNNCSRNVESPEDVRLRFISLIAELEKLHENRDLLLVSHGDILQIGLTWPAGLPASEHRSQNHLKTAEIRPLWIG